VDSERYSIVSDYLGRPVQAFDDSGELVWQTEYDIYGGLRHLEGEKGFIPFRMQGMYADNELDGLYYNRFRWYDSNAGNYISQDPIGLIGGNSTLYAFVIDANSEIDEFGLFFGKVIGSAQSTHTFGHAAISRIYADIYSLNPKVQHVTLDFTPKDSITTGSYSYQWGISHRLLQKSDDVSGLITTFECNEFDDLSSAVYLQGSEVETIYKVPDRIGAVYRQWDRRDREYGKGGKLLEDKEYYYHYDPEGNLIFKECRQVQPDGMLYIDKKQRAKALGIAYRGSGMGWEYDWYSNGMLRKVTRLDGAEVLFTYDGLGRRLTKCYLYDVTRWVWDGNTPLHECVTKHKDKEKPLPPIHRDDENLITWVFEDGTFVPVAKITKDEQFTIVTDYLGTPVQMYNRHGEKTWDCTLDIYGKVRTFEGSSLSDCMWRYQGQYEDAETGLYYNRFRYYDSSTGNYLNQDPIGLVGNNPTLYSYVPDTNGWVDIWGLELVVVDPMNINYSQRTVSQIRIWDASKYTKPIDVIVFDGQMVSYDNRRLLAAQNAGLESLEVNVVNGDDIMPGSKSTWSDKFKKTI
jgi:RHS repeat-associated protein